MSTRQSIITAMRTALEGIRVKNGYESDLGTGIHEWKQTVDTEALDCLVLFDIASKKIDPVEDDDNAGDKHWKQMTVKLAIFSSGSTSTEKLRTYLEDVYRVIGENLTWGDYAHDTELDGDELDIDQRSKTYGAMVITLFVTYVVTAWSD